MGYSFGHATYQHSFGDLLFFHFFRYQTVIPYLSTGKSKQNINDKSILRSYCLKIEITGDCK